MAKFDYFVVFAEMRTGSNFLEANLNAMQGVTCYGEAFNPHFIGYPNQQDILGVTQAQRENNPKKLINHIKRSDGIGGFRYFHDHDPRILDQLLSDSKCAKIILTRNPVDSYVSWKIAQATGQWKLTNVKNAKSDTAQFDEAEFERHLAALQDFQVTLLNALQRSGQTAFYVAYEDLQDLEVMNGLASFLGVEARLASLDKTLKKQNPDPIEAKVSNFDAMERALARLDRFNLSRTPNFEPRRGAVIPQYVAPGHSPILYMPIKGGPETQVVRWLAELDGAEVQTGFNHRTLRDWKVAHPGNRSFTVVRHPVLRAHAAFCDHILGYDDNVFYEIRKTLTQVFKLALPEQVPPGPDYDDAAHRAAFLAFLSFAKANVSAQTSVRIDPAWASQAAIVTGFSQNAAPDAIFREDQLGADLVWLMAGLGRTDAPAWSGQQCPHADRLARIYDAEIEKAAQDAYQRDYITFGFSAWAET